ncbi:MAG: hypothetical protein JW384_02323 [Nitrosomonadaceae bacterium]|jgi:hypothetical protein|nr:hypothetical protein [Nitrosomonadaceae bacterium]
MTRKDYRVLATALGLAGTNMGDQTWEATLNIVALSLSNNYPNFNRVMFEEAANTTRAFSYCPQLLAEVNL